MNSQISFHGVDPLVVFSILFCTLVGIIVIIDLNRRRKYRGVTQKLPTEFGIPILGVVYKWLSLTNFFPSFEFYFKKFQSYTYCTWLGTDAFIITADPDIIKTVLTSENFLNKAMLLYSPIQDGLPNGLLSSTITKWKHNRKLINSSFTPTILKNFVPIFQKGTASIIEKFNELADKGEQDIFKTVKRVLLSVSTETAMGIKIQDGVAVDEEFVSRFTYIVEKIAEIALMSVVHLEFIVRNKKYSDNIKFLKDYVNKLIVKKLEAKDSNNNPETDNSDNIKKTTAIFIDQAFKFYENGQFELDDVNTESQTMIVAAFETVSIAVYSVLVLLSMHPEIQEKVFEEIQIILPTKDAVIEYEHLKSIPYLDMVVNESLRLIPSIPFIGRTVISDTDVNGVILPKGIQIGIPIFNLHRRKDIWGEDADSFNPDNFLSDNIAQRHAYAYMPFSKGLRNCIGWRYAEIATRVTLLGVLRNFKFSTTFKYKDLKFIENVTIKYEKEPLLKIEKRD